MKTFFTLYALLLGDRTEIACFWCPSEAMFLKESLEIENPGDVIGISLDWTPICSLSKKRKVS